jgi:putative PEP-CTERM system TPR-repeat lipoprotein
MVSLIDAQIRSGNVVRALEVAKEAESVHPRDYDVLAVIGRAYLSVGDNRQAGLVFDRMARVAEDNPQRLLKSAQLQMSARNHHAAILILDILLKRFPNFYPAQGLMAEIEMSQGKLDSAESRARALADRTPNLSLPHRIFGDIAMAQGRYPEALSNYKKAISIERNPEYAIRQSRAYIALGDSVNARAVLESWTRSDPNDILVAEALAESLLAAGELKSARAKYEALMKRYGERAGWLNNLANILWRLGDSQAKTFAERAYKLDPSDPYIADTVGWILVQTAQIEAGLQYLRDARLRNPSNPEIRYHLAFALAKVGRSKEAIQELDYALASAVPFDETGEAKKLRQSLIH